MLDSKFAVLTGITAAILAGWLADASVVAPTQRSVQAQSTQQQPLHAGPHAAGVSAEPIRTAVEPIPTGVPAYAPGPADPSIADLHADIREILSRYNARAEAAVLVVSLDRGDTIFSFNPDVPLAPASNMKLYSTAAALYYLGPDFRYSTYVLGTGDIRNGVLEGDLILYGTGDPSISGRMMGGSILPLRALADTLAARGLVEVRGDLIGDGSYFDAEWLGRGWSPENFGAAYSAPVGALSFGENLVQISLRPGAVGSPGTISTIPATRGMAILNRTITVASGQSGIRFDHTAEGLVVTGRIARGHGGIDRTVPVVDPVNYTAAVFRGVLESRGIQVTGHTRSITDAAESPVSLAGRGSAASENQRPHPRVFAVHLSPPLSELISVTNHVSHNLFAEALMKSVGRVALGEGTFDGGSRAIRYLMECEGQVDSTKLSIVDGSGLSPLNRVTARATIQLLDLMTRNQHWDTYLASLPQAGFARPIGLRRMIGTPAERNLRAKTGTIRNVSSLSGYVTATNGERLAFAIIANQLPASTWAAKRIEDDIGARLASFERWQPSADADLRIAHAADAGPAAAGDATQRDLPELAESASAPAEQEATAPAESPRTHRVRAGETMDAIARRYGVTVAELQVANPGVNPRRIQIGQAIRLP